MANLDVKGTGASSAESIEASKLALEKYEAEQKEIMEGRRSEVSKAFAQMYASEKFTMDGACEAFGITRESRAD
jgi:hypothetical protein